MTAGCVSGSGTVASPKVETSSTYDYSPSVREASPIEGPKGAVHPGSTDPAESVGPSAKTP